MMLLQKLIIESQPLTRMVFDVSLVHSYSADGLVDPDTQIPFPIRLPLTSLSSPNLSLVGLGVRKVSFLRVKVYSVGFYLEESLTNRLAGLPGWSVSSAPD